MVCKLIYIQIVTLYVAVTSFLRFKNIEFSSFFTLSIVVEQAEVNELPDSKNKDVDQPGKYFF
jgi:hypothetical protein